jgi:hypothetical protein
MKELLTIAYILALIVNVYAAYTLLMHGSWVCIVNLVAVVWCVFRLFWRTEL